MGEFRANVGRLFHGNSLFGFEVHEQAITKPAYILYIAVGVGRQIQFTAQIAHQWAQQIAGFGTIAHSHFMGGLDEFFKMNYVAARRGQFGQQRHFFDG